MTQSFYSLHSFTWLCQHYGISREALVHGSGFGYLMGTEYP